MTRTTTRQSRQQQRWWQLGGDDPNPNNLNSGSGCAGTTPTTITGMTAIAEGGALQRRPQRQQCDYNLWRQQPGLATDYKYDKEAPTTTTAAADGGGRMAVGSGDGRDGDSDAIISFLPQAHS
ncbi:hypothetical protein EDB89DRAFT_1905903 [Lactarius sanguifluus]|nr:hypothetical protein EDB89DRAFT_1905903 [Lactarius sanguifluus]